ncbi:MAG: hypothetical protein DRQ47_03165, partial [Gammaproteobacteria bacterium]
MSYATVYSRACYGISAPLVTVEVHLSNGLPSMSIVGLASAEVKESRERVRSALLNSNFEFPARRIIINLGPADLPKSGGRFDLSIALGILVASGQLNKKLLNKFEVIGELALNGELRSVRGVLTATLAAIEDKNRILMCSEDGQEASLSGATNIYCGINLRQITEGLKDAKLLRYKGDNKRDGTPEKVTDLVEVIGNQHAKRALLISASAGH